jgi:hypothetical protein
LRCDGGKEKNARLLNTSLVENTLESLTLDGRKSPKELEGNSFDSEEGEGEDTTGEDESVGVDGCARATYDQ